MSSLHTAIASAEKKKRLGIITEEEYRMVCDSALLAGIYEDVDASNVIEAVHSRNSPIPLPITKAISRQVLDGTISLQQAKQRLEQHLNDRTGSNAKKKDSMFAWLWNSNNYRGERMSGSNTDRRKSDPSFESRRNNTQSSSGGNHDSEPASGPYSFSSFFFERNGETTRNVSESSKNQPDPTAPSKTAGIKTGNSNIDARVEATLIRYSDAMSLYNEAAAEADAERRKKTESVRSARKRLESARQERQLDDDEGYRKYLQGDIEAEEARDKTRQPGDKDMKLSRLGVDTWIEGEQLSIIEDDCAGLYSFGPKRPSSITSNTSYSTTNSVAAMSISSSICSADRASSEIDRVTKLEAELVALEAAAAESERRLSANIIAKRKHVDECYTNLEDLLTELHGRQSLECEQEEREGEAARARGKPKTAP